MQHYTLQLAEEQQDLYWQVGWQKTLTAPYSWSRQEVSLPLIQTLKFQFLQISCKIPMSSTGGIQLFHRGMRAEDMSIR